MNTKNVIIISTIILVLIITGYFFHQNFEMEPISEDNTQSNNEKCAQAGEPINSSQLQGKTDYADKCCEGLTGITMYYINDEGECENLVGNPYLWCVPCGNGICDKYESIEESKCSCPEDCK